MQFNRLRLTGFKSFVDPTELYIEEGLTGVVGPNGCGKSNLLEALRWVMGETRPKNIRGDGMDDVIFAGTAVRPARNLAEVTLLLDNATRTAPAAFNDSDQIELSRRIERESGSVYRLNGREARARDVQLMFADLATGAHSPSLVSQGRIGTLINAKPKDRRAILEEAAGTSGLHSRRHEAELRLKAAQKNLERLADLMTQIEAQLAGLKRQARQASRYRTIADRLRATEAMMLHLRWLHATDALGTARQALTEIESTVEERTRATAVASSAQAEAAATLPPLRETEAQAAAAAHRLEVAQENLDAEAARLHETILALTTRIEQIDKDGEREQTMARDAAEHLERLSAEAEKLREEEASHAGRLDEAREAVESLANTTVEAEDTLDRLNEQAASAAARRASLTGQIESLSRRADDLRSRLAATEAEQQTLANKIADNPAQQQAAQRVADARRDLDMARDTSDDAQAAQTEAALAEETARDDLSEVKSVMQQLQAEESALSTLVGGNSDQYPPILDAIQVDPGFEAAMAAALGDDLDLPADPEAPAFWQTLPDASDGALPSGAESLAQHVQAPQALSRALAQVGVVDADQGGALQAGLNPGQILVSAEGDAWRWDGKTVKAGAKTAAAIRLEQRNRLEAVIAEIAALQPGLDAATATLHTATESLDDKSEKARAGGAALRAAEEALIEARNAEAEAAQAFADQNSRVGALAETAARLGEDLADAESKLRIAQQDLSGLPSADAHAAPLATAREAVGDARNALADAKATRDGLAREAQFRATRLGAIGGETGSWQERAKSAATQLEQLATRRAEAETEYEALKDKPAALEEKRTSLAGEIETAVEKRRTATAALAEAESVLSERDTALRAAEQSLSEAREHRARIRADLEHAEERLEGVRVRIAEDLECRPEDTLEASGHNPDKPLPEMDDINRKLERLRRERDTMGAVNLRAEEEAKEVQENLDTMLAEKEDLEAAIAKLRQAISQLNREGRERLNAAFGEVNEHFTDLFQRLFGGGQAHLELTESDDPLEAGLEIYASPPGKRLQNMSLLSGGEQALTALSLIFAVFLTNPAPICVLDEVDAPLDDANVERFCDLLHEISQATETRFLVVTHHAVTMAKLHRLFGVTMAEQGVSQLVSVDLGQAEQLIAAE
ncbi:MAG: chromosome segregation protein SMC [Alphaproteobacteria bacterium]